ncbi:cell division protein ZapE [Pseudochelatococcus contaminans]|uniref:Cell division protein ZapE n=1 Tax=Pseudochelatococcus contaminans TaxID=1538103 RepID=A0A7W5Z353_9HYPH|nr:cell division protein ZapE [Pseudochelatococcus contaminans]MBB3809258.1 cell division protein ZapE [Pseudochelatococcus contaminans]
MTATVPAPQSTLSGPVRERYEALVASGAIERDPAQEILVGRLDGVVAALAASPRPAKTGRLARFLGGGREAKAEPVRGLYVWGSVGRGKTMLMDLFIEAAPVERKRRAHFHDFMADVHERIFRFRQRVKDGSEKDTDPIPRVAAELAAEATLLCFDEFTVTDIADAMILGRLFSALFGLGVTIVATSNVVPDRLYEGGLNRALFVPFIALLLERMDVVELSSRTDYRLEKLNGADVYHTPNDAKARVALDEAFRRLAGGAPAAPIDLDVKGHRLHVPLAAGGVARFSFADLCSQALGASDYLYLAKHYHSIVLDDIPVLNPDRRNEAKRFITLIDALYDRHVKLVASAEADATGLYLAEEGREAFEFDRTVSRLIEMRSEDYLALPHGRGDSLASGDSSGLVET